MFLTEKQAKRKSCPMTMNAPAIFSPLDGSMIRDGGPFDCIGKKCAAWQWVAPSEDDPNDENMGYCGMSRQVPGA